MRRKIIALAFAAIALSACSTSIAVEDKGNDTCIQKRDNKIFGLTFSSEENFVNCTSSD